MFLKIKEAITSRGNNTNEDIYNATLAAAWVMDGSSDSLAESYEEFFKKLEEGSLEKMLEDIRKTQEEDESCSRYPRFKKGDDATAVYLEIE